MSQHEAHTALDLFGQPPDVEAAAERVPQSGATVAIARRWVDFHEPAAPRLAVEIIVGLTTKAERQEALDMVPLNFQGMVKIMVERAFYNQKRERVLAAR